jgi:hypothetical protein
MFQERKTSRPAVQREPTEVVTPDDRGIAIAKRGQIIESGAAGPCTLIGMLDRRSGVAVLGHFVRPNDVNEDDFASMLEQGRKLFKNPKTVDVFLAGCSTESDLDFDEAGGGYGAGDARRSRQLTIDKIVRAGYSRDAIRTEWQDEVFLTQAMFINLSDCSVSIETMNMDDRSAKTTRY